MAEQEKITVRDTCGDCGGTGIYVGFNCHDGAGMVCDRCNGEGWVPMTYTPFVSRKKRTDVTRVFETRKWTHIYPTNHTFGDGTEIHFSEFGCTYEEWENGVIPKPFPENTPLV